MPILEALRWASVPLGVVAIAVLVLSEPQEVIVKRRVVENDPAYQDIENWINSLIGKAGGNIGKAGCEFVQA